MYQRTDDHLPSEIGGSLFLFTANLYADESLLIRSSIEMSVYREMARCDFVQGLGNNLADQNDEIVDSGEWTVGGIPFRCVEIGAYRRQQRIGTIRFVCTLHSTELWLYAKLAGYSDTGAGSKPPTVYSGTDFGHTKNVFETLRPIQQMDS